MAVKLGSLKRDSHRERNGEWIEIPDYPGVAFLVRSTSYHPYVVARATEVRRVLQRFKDEPVPEEVNADINGRLATEHLLLGWRGFDVEFSPETAAEVMTDPEYRDVRGNVFWAASQVGLNKLEFVDQAGKNSERRSAGD